MNAYEQWQTSQALRDAYDRWVTTPPEPKEDDEETEGDDNE
jgi:hypothetical protein